MGDLLDQGDHIDITVENTLTDIDPIRNSIGEMIQTKSEISNIVEEPLVAACEELYDKNVRTLSTSANKDDLESGQIYIVLNYRELSNRNREIADQCAVVKQYDQHFGTSIASIMIPVTKNSTVKEISNKARKIAQAFSKQQPTWIPRYSIDDLKKIFRIPDEDEGFDSPEVWKEEGYFYDPKSKRFYLSEEHFLKVKDAENLKE